MHFIQQYVCFVFYIVILLDLTADVKVDMAGKQACSGWFQLNDIVSFIMYPYALKYNTIPA